jgi:hypothetical protein
MDALLSSKVVRCYIKEKQSPLIDCTYRATFPDWFANAHNRALIRNIESRLTPMEYLPNVATTMNDRALKTLLLYEAAIAQHRETQAASRDLSLDLLECIVSYEGQFYAKIYCDRRQIHVCPMNQGISRSLSPQTLMNIVRSSILGLSLEYGLIK